jgi:hypothetical protein
VASQAAPGIHPNSSALPEQQAIIAAVPLYSSYGSAQQKDKKLLIRMIYADTLIHILALFARE